MTKKHGREHSRKSSRGSRDKVKAAHKKDSKKKINDTNVTKASQIAHHRRNGQKSSTEFSKKSRDSKNYPYQIGSNNEIITVGYQSNLSPIKDILPGQNFYEKSTPNLTSNIKPTENFFNNQEGTINFYMFTEEEESNHSHINISHCSKSIKFDSVEQRPKKVNESLQESKLENNYVSPDKLEIAVNTSESPKLQDEPVVAEFPLRVSDAYLSKLCPTKKYRVTRVNEDFYSIDNYVERSKSIDPVPEQSSSKQQIYQRLDNLL